MVDTVLVLAGMYRTGTYTDIEMPAFYMSLNTGHVPTIAADFGHYLPISGVPAGTGKNLFFFFFVL